MGEEIHLDFDCLREQVLGYPPIVNQIFQHITTYEDLRACELVCTTWKHEAAKLLRDHDILYKIFQYLQPRDIGACRLVSNKWRLSANHLLKSEESKTVVCIKDREAVTQFIKTFDTNPCLFAHFEFGKDLPLATVDAHRLTNNIGVHVNRLRLTINSTWTFEILEAFLFETLPNLSDLMIFNWNIFRPETESTTQLNQPPRSYYCKTTEQPRLPNLKKLNIFLHLVDNHQKPLPSAKEFVTNILLAAPNLEYLGGSPRKTRRFIFEIILSEPQIVFPRMSNLDVARLTKPLTTELFSQLEGKQFPLKIFRIGIRNRKYPLEALYSFLTSLQDSLESLELYVTTGGMEIFKEFPKSLCTKLKKLKNFTLSCEAVENGYDFFQYLEQLEDLSLMSTDMSKFRFEESLIYPQTTLFANLKRLHLDDVNGVLDESPFRNLRVTISRT